ncbi:MAG: hypothetical protein ACOYOE_13220 [Chlorobium sp.]
MLKVKLQNTKAIMSIYSDITPTDLRDYMKFRGWLQVKEALADGEFLFNHPDSARQIYFPVHREVPGFEEALQVALEKLAALESVEPWLLGRHIEESRDDTVSFRVMKNSMSEGSIPLVFAYSMLQGAENLLLSAAHTVLKPQFFHPRLNRTEAKKFLEASRFRHTEPGSFILKISCPLYALDVASENQTELKGFENNAPFVRKTMALLNKSIRSVIAAIEADTLDALVENEKQSESPSISYNLCNAIASFYSEGLGNSLEIKNQWSLLKPVNDTSLNKPNVIQQEYFPRFEEVARELKPSDDPVVDTFYGTVEELSGEIGSHGERSGEVLLHLLLPQGEQIKVRVNLDATQYQKADKAHMAAHNAYVKVKGKLLQGKQPQRLTEVSEFELAES